MVAFLALPLTAVAQSPAPPSRDQVQALLGDPSVDGPDVSIQYVGTTSDPDVYVAVVDGQDGSVRLYLCDGADLGVWLEGTIADGSFEASGSGGASAAGTADGATFSGTVTLGD